MGAREPHAVLRLGDLKDATMKDPPAMDFRPAIDRILGKFEEARRQDARCFGCEHHLFRLGPVLSEEKVRASEDEHGVRLPEEYRQFLLYAGHGGAGPYYGLLKRLSWPAFDLDEEKDDSVDSFLARPCLLRPEMESDIDWLSGLKCRWEDRYQGTLPLVAEGCSYWVVLIVSGPQRGRVVNIDLSDQPPIFCTDTDFLAWYERWLDEMLWGWDTHWFGHTRGGSEEELAVAARHEAEPGQRREALRSLSRIPHPTTRTHQAIRDALDDSAAIVRLAAVAAVKAEMTDAVARTIELLADDDPDVRDSAARTIFLVHQPAARTLDSQIESPQGRGSDLLSRLYVDRRPPERCL
jgi:hypothetical protein